MQIRIRKLSMRLLVAIVTFAIGVLVTTLWVAPRFTLKEQTLQLEIPDSRWEAAFFDQLKERTTAVNLPSLRTVVLPDRDLEVRFWYDRFEIIDGIVIRRIEQQWSAHWVYQRKDSLPSSAKMVTLDPPKSGWESFWKNLVNSGILTLPDSPPQCVSEVLDGIGYIVETNVDRKYRTYRYGNPQVMKCPEAKQMLELEKTIDDEFRLFNSMGMRRSAFS